MSDAIAAASAILRKGDDLPETEAEAFAVALTSEEGASSEQRQEALSLLHRKGETVTELEAFARVYRRLARNPEVGDRSAEAIDIVGTGGDHSGSFNFSTTSALILAAGGVTVCKHGNRSITSKTGSADLLAALGIDLEADTKTRNESLDTLGFTFFFAPLFHPAFKAIVPVRKAMAAQGERSIFNLLGPLINPATPPHQLLGVFSADWVERIAGALERLNLKRGLVVHCRMPDGGGMDELSCAGENVLAGVGELAGTSVDCSPEAFGLSACSPADLKGGDSETNLGIFHSLVRGDANPGLRDTQLLNAGASFWIAGVVDDLPSGIAKAHDVLEGGALAEWLQRIPDVYAQS